MSWKFWNEASRSRQRWNAFHDGAICTIFRQNRIKWEYDCANLKAENMQMHSCLCVSVLTTLRWHNVWTELWEQWWILAAWSLQQGTRNYCQVSTGWSAGYSDPLDTGGGCTIHKVSVCGEQDNGGQRESEEEYSQQEWEWKVGLSILMRAKL